MKEKIKEFRIKRSEEGADIVQFRYFNAFTAEEALNYELAVRAKEGDDKPVALLEEYNPYSDKWTKINLNECGRTS